MCFRYGYILQNVPDPVISNTTLIPRTQKSTALCFSWKYGSARGPGLFWKMAYKSIWLFLVYIVQFHFKSQQEL